MNTKSVWLNTLVAASFVLFGFAFTPVHAHCANANHNQNAHGGNCNGGGNGGGDQTYDFDITIGGSTVLTAAGIEQSPTVIQGTSWSDVDVTSVFDGSDIAANGFLV